MTRVDPFDRTVPDLEQEVDSDGLGEERLEEDVARTDEDVTGLEEATSQADKRSVGWHCPAPFAARRCGASHDLWTPQLNITPTGHEPTIRIL